MTTKDGTVQVSIERFKELEEYESSWNKFDQGGYIYRKITYGRFGSVLEDFMTRKDFKDKLYKQMLDKIDILEKELEEVENVPTFSPERIEVRKCWFCKN